MVFPDLFQGQMEDGHPERLQKGHPQCDGHPGQKGLSVPLQGDKPLRFRLFQGIHLEGEILIMEFTKILTKQGAAAVRA